MLDRTFISMKTSITLIILTILHTKVDSADIDDIGNILSDKEQMWNEAFNACQTNNSRLPTLLVVNGKDFVLETQIHTDVDKCFWLGAMYEYNTQDISGEFPIDSCESVRKLGDKYIYDWQNCGTNLTFLCAADDNTASYINHEYLTWSQASKRCHDQNVLLPSKNNSAYLDHITVESRYWWLNSTKHLNLSPSYAKYGDTPLCLCHEDLRDIQCPADTKTICFPYDSGLNIRTTSSIPKSGQPLETSHSTPTVIVTSIIVDAKQSNGTRNVPSAYDRVTFNTNLSAGVKSSNVMINLTTSHCRSFQDPADHINVLSDKDALVRGLTGAVVFLAIALIIVTIFTLKLLRDKRKAKDGNNSKTLNARRIEDSAKKISPFDLDDEDGISLDVRGSSEMQTVLAECGFDSREQEAKSLNKDIQDDQKLSPNTNSPLYINAQQCQRKTTADDEKDHCDNGCNTYDKIHLNEESEDKHVYNVVNYGDGRRYGVPRTNV